MLVLWFFYMKHLTSNVDGLTTSAMPASNREPLRCNITLSNCALKVSMFFYACRDLFSSVKTDEK